MDQILLQKTKLLIREQVAGSQTPTSLTPEPEIDHSEVSTISELDIDLIPPGIISNRWLILSQDSTGEPIKIPLIIAKGYNPGPVVGITAAIHGNELNGIPLIHQLLKDLNCTTLFGVVVASPITNIPGYKLRQRAYSDGIDLNRIFPGSATGTSSQIYAHNLLSKLISKFTYLIDLHTASRGRVNSLYVRANMLNPVTKKMAILQNPQIVVHNKSVDGSLRGAAMSMNIPSIAVEIGDPSKFQKGLVKHALTGVINILKNLDMIDIEGFISSFEPLFCSKSYWIYSDVGGLLNVLPDINTWVKKGDVIAKVTSVFGDVEKIFRAESSGIVVGKSIEPVCDSGSRILHLGIVGDSYAPETNDGHL